MLPGLPEYYIIISPHNFVFPCNNNILSCTLALTMKFDIKPVILRVLFKILNSCFLPEYWQRYFQEKLFAPVSRKQNIYIYINPDLFLQTINKVP